MRPTRYTFLVIPDTGDDQREYHVSRLGLRLGIAAVILLVGGVLGTLIYFAPRMVEYGSLKKRYQKLASERVSVLNLLQDLERIQLMDQQIRKTLGPELQFPAGTETDSAHAVPVPGVVPDKPFRVSYVENLPSTIPVLGYVTQKMHTNLSDPVKNHYGIDVAVKEGDPVVAAASGYVIFSGWTYDLGNMVILYHGNGYFTRYGHFQRNLVSDRDYVHRGEVIGLAGNSGISSGTHLHFEIWKDGQSLDPFIFFPEYALQDISSDEDQ
ncbi:MAG: M23 family metallopeptidase [Candidatus Neomarinimicrobiota bacterium]|nr:MAG: M23 family metallopeptidase [Candidatus Neomarinimicrobiota bacterium]